MDIISLRHRLREAPYDFLSAVSSLTLSDFDKEWHALCKDVDEASRLSMLSNEDNSLVHSTASLLAVWGESFLKTQDETASRTANLMNDIQSVFAQLTISDINDSIPQTRPAYRPASISPPSFIPAAYSWLLQNIHDPYPSSQIKERTSRDARRPLRVITDWFKDARRYIGWVAMCKNHFQSSRALAVQAAKHAYLHTDSSQLSLSSDIVSQFEDIRKRLRNMYPMADDGDDLSDDTDDSFTPSWLSSCGYPSNQSPYARSRSSSSTPSLVFSTDDEDNHSLASMGMDDPSVSIGKRKNRNEEDELRPLKRNRSGFISVADRLVKDPVTVPLIASATLGSNVDPSSPTSSPSKPLAVAAADLEDTSSTSPTMSSQCDSPPLRVPKRRLSVSDAQPAPKRPCLPPAIGPRKQAVSTPIPIARQATPDVDDWFRTFELSDTLLPVQLFSNWDVVVDVDAYPYNYLSDGIPSTDGQDLLDATPLSDLYQLPAWLDLDESLVINPSVLDASTAFTDAPLTNAHIDTPPTHSTASISTPSSAPITAISSSEVFDFLDAFLSTIKAESAEPQSTQSSSSPSTELSLDDSIELFGDLVNP